MKKFKYVIFSPRNNSGGVIALHVLCKNLTEQGENARIFYNNRFQYKNNQHIRFWLRYFFVFLIKDTIFGILYKILGEKRFKLYHPNSIKGCRRKILPFVSRNTIVVYPEIVVGNPLNAGKVVRWLLYYNTRYKRLNSKTIGYDESDLFFAYRQVFNDKNLNPEERTVCTPYFDLDLYKQTNFGERKGSCYILRKGSGRNDLPSSFDGIVVDDLPEREKVRVFNECEYCISYDTQTAYSKIAALCGCISVIVPEEGKNRSDYRTSTDDSSGIAFGFSSDEINYAKTTRNRIKTQFKEGNEKSKESVKHFIDECENYFSRIKS